MNTVNIFIIALAACTSLLILAALAAKILSVLNKRTADVLAHQYRVSQLIALNPEMANAIIAYEKKKTLPSEFRIVHSKAGELELIDVDLMVQPNNNNSHGN